VSGNSFIEAWKAGSSVGPPIVSGGVVWTIESGGLLQGYTPDSGTPVASVDLGDVPQHFPTPAAGGGRLFAPADTQVIAFAGV
jgi:hypothetical protein